MQFREKISDAGTVYKIDTIDGDGKPEVQFKYLKRLVGKRGFEPPTPLVPNQIPPQKGYDTEFCRVPLDKSEGGVKDKDFLAVR